MMKRKITILLLFFVCLGSLGQSKNIKIYWKDTPIEAKDTANSRKDRLQSQLGLQLGPSQVVFERRWKDIGVVNPKTVKIEQAKWGDLTASELKEISKNLIPNSLEFEITTSKGRNELFTVLTISPVVKRDGRYQKLLSFTVTYAYGPTPQNAKRMPLSNSVLSEGDWFQFKINKTGVYKLDKGFLEDLGMNTNSIDPRNLKVFGMGGKPLPLLNADNSIFDLPETAIQVVGEEDGSFDNGDYVLFYGIGVEGYDAENDTHLNPYSDESFYYVTASGDAGRRIEPMVEPSGSPSLILGEFLEEQFVENDEYSPARVGRQWFGNRFDIESSQSFEFDFQNIVPSKPVSIKIRAVASSEVSTSMAVSVNNTSFDPLTFSAIDDPIVLRLDEAEIEVQATSGNVKVDLDYNNGGNPTSVGYLDYIHLEAFCTLAGRGGQLPFFNPNAATLNGIVEYQVTNANGFSQIWDVTNAGNITYKANNGENNLSFKTNAQIGVQRRFVGVHPGDYFLPEQSDVSRIANQDLKGTIFLDASGNFKDIEYLIIAPPFMIQPALRLANHHKNLTGMNVKVVTTDKIYREFSSGKQDISAIRNFIRYVYENASNFGTRIKYVCLFGDTSVDYKDRLPDNNNIVPTFHARSSLDTFTSFMSDDFFTMMDENEGTMGTGSTMDIAVGRILADDVSLANTMVDKIIAYSQKPSYGNWRDTFVIISDDVDEWYEYKSLEVKLDSIADRVSSEKPFVNVKKIHCDAYQQETSAGGNRYPKVNEAIVDAIEVGALVVNYFGHGGEDGLAKEFIYNKNIAQDLKNQNRYPCIITVTCEFTKFDNPQRITAGELTYWNPEGGAISLITTTRAIQVSIGSDFNEYVSEYMFGFQTETPPYPAEAVMLAKHEIGSNNKRVVFYIGDPAMPLAFPKKSIRLTTINDQPIGPTMDTLKALSRIKMAGEILDENDNVLTDYNGILEAKVFDKNLLRQTLGNDGTRDNSNDADGDGNFNNILLLNFKTLGEILFNGQASVQNGKFEFEFVVPRDIQIPVGNGKVSLYSQRDNALEDQTGYNLDILVGGLNENATEDTQGPTIQLFMNDESFVSGGITNDSPILIAKLEDENGINTASGIGHDIVATLDGDEANPFVLNEYYQAAVDDYMRGTVNYKLRNLEEGLHTLTLKAWDVYNNSSTAEIQFVVAGDGKLKITRVLNYPNPFVSYTEFWFNHNHPFEPLEVQVQVFTVTGKVVWTHNQIVNTDGFLSRNIIWNGTDDFGDRIGKGTYVYKLTVKSTLTGQQVEKFEKLVILK